MSMTPEGRVKHAVKKWLKARGIWFYMPVQNGMGRVGIPDFICCAAGRFVAIETKAPGKRHLLTPNQHSEITGIHRANGTAVVVDDAGQLDSLEVLREKTERQRQAA